VSQRAHTQQGKNPLVTGSSCVSATNIQLKYCGRLLCRYHDDFSSFVKKWNFLINVQCRRFARKA